MLIPIAGLLLAALMSAQAIQAPSATADESRNSISGVVRDRGTGAPLAGVSVWVDTDSRLRGGFVIMGPGGKRVTATTDGQGRYKLSDVPAGQYRVSARGSSMCFASSLTRDVTVYRGQDLAGVDFRLSACATISGKVLDEHGQPLAGVTVFLIDREYYLGRLRYPVKMLTRTDDRGDYTLQAQPERSHLLLGVQRDLNIDSMSTAPADPALRRPVIAPAYYSRSSSIEGAEPIVLRAGERREEANITLSRSPSFCLEGVLKAEGVPAALPFNLLPAQPSLGLHSEGGLVLPQPSGKSGSDGRIRICGLPAGQYQLAVSQPSTSSATGHSLFGANTVTITDRDVRGVEVVAQTGASLQGQVVWADTQPDPPLDSQVRIGLRPLGGVLFTGQVTEARSSIPGAFSLAGLQLEDYSVQVYVPAPDAYVKDITYGGLSVLHEPLRFGSALGNAEIRIILAHDGASLGVKAVDKEGNPLPGSYVYILPAAVTSEAMLAATLISGRADTAGYYSSTTLAPGKYYALVTDAPLDPSPESAAKLWRTRFKAQEVDIGSGSGATLTLGLTSID